MDVLITLGTGFYIWYLFTLDRNILSLIKSKETYMKTYQIITTTSERITVTADSLTEACKGIRESGYYVAKVFQVA